MPIITLPRLLLSLLSLLILAAAVYLLWSWADGSFVRDADGVLRRVHGPPWLLYSGLGLLAWSFLGRFVVLMFFPKGKDEPRETRGEGRDVPGADGSTLHVESYGPAQAPATLVLTHGWGLNSTAWYYAKRALADQFRLVVWDLPGLGKSRQPKDGKITLDRFAQDLGAVVQTTQGPVVLVGHSIGGMTTETFWRACPDELKRRVAGVVLVDTTFKDPLQTMWLSGLWRALRWPVIEPLCWLTILLTPVAWLASWQGYLSGMNQLAMRLTGFGRYATRGQVDFTARLACKGSPGVQAKGNLAMFRWEAGSVLPTIHVPVLILSGTKDIVTLPEASERMRDALPDATLLKLEGGGHMGFMEKAEAYNRAIGEFARRVAGPAAPVSA